MAHLGHEQLTVSSTAVGFADIPTPEPTRAHVAVEGADVRFRLDGATTAPTTSVGVIIRDGGAKTFVGNDVLHNVKFIRDGSVDATLDIAYS